jgi:Ca-activated chloride channel family protein
MPEQAMHLARQLGIRVYTIGIGTTGRAPFSSEDMFGRETITYASVSMDEPLLKKIAETTGGTYFNVRNIEGLQQTLEHIDALEKTEVESEIHNQYEELFQWLIAPSLALVGLAAWLGTGVGKKVV